MYCGGRRRDRAGGALQKELQKVQAEQLDSGVPGDEEGVQKFSVQR